MRMSILIMILMVLSSNYSYESYTEIIVIDLADYEPKFNNFEPLEVVEDRNNFRYAKVTGYAPLDNKSGICADDNPEVTSRGHYPSRQWCAVDPSKIAYGTTLYIEGYGNTVAGDTGGALRNYDGIHVDLFFETYEEAMAWGVKYMMIEIIESED